MSVIIPNVNINNAELKITRPDGLAGTVAIIGAFDTTDTTVQSFNKLKDARAKLAPLSDSDEKFVSCKCLNHLFITDGVSTGITNLLAVNVNTSTNRDTPTSIDLATLTSALNKIKGENWDILFIAAELPADPTTQQETCYQLINTFLKDSYASQKPYGVVLPVNRPDIAKIKAVGDIFDRGVYGLIVQSFNSLSLIESAAYYTGYISGITINRSMTMKQIPFIKSLGKEYTFAEDDDGYKLVEAGITVFKCLDRQNNKYVVVKSALPSGYDLAIERSLNYILRQFQLEEFLGDPSTDATLDSIKGEIETQKYRMINDLRICETIDYEIIKSSATCIDINIKVGFAGIIDEIQVYVSVEVQ